MFVRLCLLTLSTVLVGVASAQSASFVPIGNTPFDQQAVALASHQNQFYVVGRGNLQTVDVRQGTLSPVVAVQLQREVALASHGGSLYLIGGEQLSRLDTTTGEPTRIGEGRYTFGQVALCSHDGALYLLGQQRLFLIGNQAL